MINKRYTLKQLKGIILRHTVATMMLAVALPAAAQVPGSALDYMLQRPRVAKYYPHKRLFDHLFLDGGVGVNMVGVRHPNRLGAYGEINIGDWLSPEHGLRLTMNGGLLRTQGVNAKYAGLGLDYMLNITALAQAGNQYRPKPFEVYGIAGLDLTYSRNKGISDRGYGAHVALRGQVALSHTTYFYVEPRAGLMLDNVPQAYTWHGYRPVASIAMGFGYRLPERGWRNTYTDSLALPSLANGLFLSMAGGPTFVSNAHPSTWRHNAGFRLVASMGKWFDAYQGVRLGINATTFKQNSDNRAKTFGLQADYLFNLHNLFMGPNPYRPFWVNGVVGASYNHTTDIENARHHNVWGVGAGLQANLRLSDAFALTLEPRIDVHGKYFAPHTSSFKDYDALPSLLAGITYTYHRRQNTKRLSDDADANSCFSSVGIYGGVTNRLSMVSDYRAYMPMGRVVYTQWHGANGWRVSAQAFMQRQMASRRFAQVSGGADWLMDLTAHSYGVDPNRVLSVAVLAGANVGVDYSRGTTYFAPDVHGGAQLRLRLGGPVSLVGEGQMAYMLGNRMAGHRNRLMPQGLVGIEYTMPRYTGNKFDKEAPEHKNMLTVGVGTGLYTANFSAMPNLGRRLSMVTSLGYGRWINGLNGVYAQASTSVTQRHGKGNLTLTSIKAGYMLNMKQAVTGVPTQDDVFQVTGIVAPTLGIATRKGYDTQVAPGIHAALQAGWKVCDAVELFVEPSTTVYSKRIEPIRTGHPAEGELNLSIGTKIHF